MNYKVIIVLCLLLGLIMSWLIKGREEVGDINGIIWPNSQEYKDKVAEFPVSVEKANQLLASAEHPERPFYGQPVFIIGDNYFFTSQLSKSTIYLQGYYVNGKTGQVEFRRSKASVDSHQKTLPTDAFGSGLEK